MTAMIEDRPAAIVAGIDAAVGRSSGLAASVVIVMPREFLSFRLGGEEYGIDILRVQEIRSYETPTCVTSVEV